MDGTSTVWSQLAQRILSVERIREVDRIAVERFRMESLVLMENAALSCVRWLEQRFPDGRDAVILCGRGNNGGDGLAIARHLRVLGWSCRVVVLGPVSKMSVDARANLDILLAGGGLDLLLWTVAGEAIDPSDTRAAWANTPAQVLKLKEQESVQRTQLTNWLGTGGVVIDAMLGSGAIGEPKEPLRTWIELANQSPAYRVAIDIPTGWNATTGEESFPTFKADATLTFVARKPAMASADAARILGEIVVLPIGIPEELIRELLASEA